MATNRQEGEKFIAGPDAPSAIEVIKDEAGIIDADGAIKIENFYRPKANGGPETMVIDCTQEPPVLFLRDAIAAVRHGHIANNGEFADGGHDPTGSGVTYVNGEYRGPESVLDLSWTIPE